MGSKLLLGAGNPPSAVSSVTIYSATPDADNGGNDGWTFRQEIPVSGSAITQVRVTILAPTSSGLVAAHASVGASAMLNDGSCTGTPTELLFGGVPGINVGASTLAVSDWVNFTGIGVSVNAMVTVDFTTGGTRFTVSPSAGNNKLWYHSNTSNPGYYATTSGAGLSPSNNDNRMVSLIETR